MDKIAEDRLFLNNSKEEVTRWINTLQYFNYMRARSGHNCEGDSFSVYFKYNNFDDLIDKLRDINISLNKIPEGFIAYDPFESYTFEDLDKLKIPVPKHTEWEQPQYVEIFGYKVHIWILTNSFEITVSGKKDGNAYKVSEEDFNVCTNLETEFEKLNWSLILDDNIKEYAHCISEKKYPELYNK